MSSATAPSPPDGSDAPTAAAVEPVDGSAAVAADDGAAAAAGGDSSEPTTPPSPHDATVAIYLTYLDTLRGVLHRSGVEIPLTFPVLEAGNSGDPEIDNIEGYHAFTDMRGGEFGKGGGGEKRAAASTIKIHGIYLRMRDAETGIPLALPGLTLTFLHECAHVLSPIVLVKKTRGGPTSGLGRNASTVDKKWFHDAHNNDFYENFNELLRTCEKLKLLKFSAAQFKFTTKWTQRVDGMTAADVSHFLTLLEVESEGLKPPVSLVDAAEAAETPRDLTLTLCHPQKGKKVIKFTSTISVKDLTKLCKKKLGGGKVCKKGLFLDHDKKLPVTDDGIRKLQQGDSLYTN